MSNLLHVIRINPKADKKALLLEMAVPEDTAPYLVSSTRSVQWVPDPTTGVRAAVRGGTVETFFVEVVQAVAEMGKKAQWGNVHPFTRQGVQAAIEHLESYGLTDIELLAHPATPKERLREVLGGNRIPLRPSSWLALDCVVVVPKEREYVGVLARVSAETFASVIHNAARGIGIAWGGVDDVVDHSTGRKKPGRANRGVSARAGGKGRKHPATGVRDVDSAG